MLLLWLLHCLLPLLRLLLLGFLRLHLCLRLLRSLTPQFCISLLDLLLLVTSMVLGSHNLTLGKVDNQLTTVRSLASKNLLSRSSIALLLKVDVSESTRKTSAAVNGDPDIRDTLDILENLLQVHICQFVGDVADVEGLGGHVVGAAGLVGRVGVLHDDLTAFVDTTVLLGNGIGGFFGSAEVDVTETGRRKLNPGCL